MADIPDSVAPCLGGDGEGEVYGQLVRLGKAEERERGESGPATPSMCGNMELDVDVAGAGEGSREGSEILLQNTSFTSLLMMTAGSGAGERQGESNFASDGDIPWDFDPAFQAEASQVVVYKLSLFIVFINFVHISNWTANPYPKNPT